MSLDDLCFAATLDDHDVNNDNFPDVEDEPTTTKKTRKEEIQWDEPKEYVLVAIYKSTNAYMKSVQPADGGKKNKKGLSMENKKLIAYNKVKAHATFASVSHLLTPSGVDAKFKRLKKAVIGKYAMDGEGANLSGLPSNASRVEEALYKMVEEEFQSNIRGGKKQAKEADRQKRLQEIQDRMLSAMVTPMEGSNPTLVPGPLPAEAQPAALEPRVSQEDSSQQVSPLSSSDTTNTTSSGGISRERPSWQAFLQRRDARRAEEKEAAASLTQQLVAMEARRIQLEEQKLQLEARRIEVDAVKAENERSMFTFFLQQRNNMGSN